MILDYFKPEEFTRNETAWFDLTSKELLIKLDVLRGMWAVPIIVSPHPDAVGRENTKNASQHDYNLWGEVRAIDVIPEKDTDEMSFITDEDEIERYHIDSFFSISKQAGFRGIGCYKYWTYKGEDVIGFHLDVRPSRKIGDPLLWTWTKENGYKYLKSGLII